MNNRILLAFAALTLAFSGLGFTAHGTYRTTQGTLISKADGGQSFEKKKKKKKKKHHKNRKHTMNSFDDDDSEIA